LILLAGSRAQENGLVDRYSDYDITLFLEDIKVLSQQNKWLIRFGEVMVGISESMEFGQRSFPSRLVIYENGTKVDFVLLDMRSLDRMVSEQKLPDWIQAGYRILVDKENKAKEIGKIFESAAPRRLPTRQEYHHVINEFFWEVTYIAKHLKRDDLWPAKYCGGILRQDMLLPMLEWYELAKRGPDYNTRHMGKGIKKWLSKDKYDQLQQTYTGADSEDNWRTLFKMMHLFREVTKEVGQMLEYPYPEDLDQKVTAYIEHIFNT